MKSYRASLHPSASSLNTHSTLQLMSEHGSSFFSPIVGAREGVDKKLIRQTGEGDEVVTVEEGREGLYHIAKW